MDDQALEELAVEEILKDLKRGKERAKEHGALGWQRNPAPPPNKRFLRNMLVSTLRDNRPFKRRRHFDDNAAHQHDSSHQRDSPPGRSTRESETHFRYRDRYHQKKDSPDNGNYSDRYRHKKDSPDNGSYRDRHCRKEHSVDNESAQRNGACSSSHSHRESLFSISHPEFGYLGKRPQELSPSPHLAEEDIIEISDSSESSQHHKKRSSTGMPDSVAEDRNGEMKDRKKRKKKHHRKTDAEDGISRHSHEKRKHKKSKKSKKHKSKRSGHSSKHKS